MKAVNDLLGGDEELSVFAFRSFAENTPASLEKLRNVSEENLPDYVITVHSLKSTTATIGAEEISAKAKKLEAMSKEGDLQGVLAENEDFLKDIDTLVKNVKRWLEA